MAPDPRAAALSREQLLAVVGLLLARQERAHVAQAAEAAIEAVLSGPAGNTETVGPANNENEAGPSQPVIIEEVSSPPPPSPDRSAEPPRPQTGRANSATNRGDGIVFPPRTTITRGHLQARHQIRRQNLTLRVAAQISAATQVASSRSQANNGRNDSLPGQGPVPTTPATGGSPSTTPRGPTTTASANNRQAPATPRGSTIVPAVTTGAVAAPSPATTRGTTTVSTTATPRGGAVATPAPVTPRGSTFVTVPTTPRGANAVSTPATSRGAIAVPSSSATSSGLTSGSSPIAWSPTATNLGGFTSARAPATPTGSTSVAPVVPPRPSPGTPQALRRRNQRGPNGLPTAGVTFFGRGSTTSGRRTVAHYTTEVTPLPDASRQCQKCKVYNPDPQSTCWYHPHEAERDDTGDVDREAALPWSYPCCGASTTQRNSGCRAGRHVFPQAN